MSSTNGLDNGRGSRVAKEYGSCGHSVFEDARFSKLVLDSIADGDVRQIQKGIHNAQHFDWEENRRLLEMVPDLNRAIISSAEAMKGDSDLGGLGALQLRLRNLNLLKVRPESATSSMDAVIEYWNVAREYREDKFLGEVAANVAVVCREADRIERQNNPKAGYPNTTDFIEYVLGTEQEFLSQNSPSTLRYWLVRTCHATYFHPFAEVDSQIQRNGRPVYESMLKFGSVDEVDLALSSVDVYVVHIQSDRSLLDSLGGVSRAFFNNLQWLLSGRNEHIGPSKLEQECKCNDRAGMMAANETLKARAERLERVLLSLT